MITSFGTLLMIFILPETKGIPLEEMAKVFGESEDVVVFTSDLHVDHNTHELVVARKGELEHVATHQGVTPEIEKAIAEHHEKVTAA